VTARLRRLTGPRLGLLALLLLSLALRVVIVLHGGQRFWPDEFRYLQAVEAITQWRSGEQAAAACRILGSADHLGFKALMLLPAWAEGHLKSSLPLPSLFLCLFSVANIGWAWCIPRRAGADEHEALWAATAMAASNTMFYWSRHLMPYDLALFWALASTWFAFGAEPRRRDSWLAGLFGFAAFVTYAGSWSLVACILTVHVLAARRGWRTLLGRAAYGLVGLGGPFALLLTVDRLLGVDLLASYRGFAGTITQGDFNEGHLVFFQYLWRTERLTALVWAGALIAFLALVRSAPAADGRRGILWVAIILAVATLLICGANLLHVFVVYGRLARQVVPFCALLVGWVAARIFRDRPWCPAEVAALAGLLACGLSSMREPLRQEFPEEFHRRAVTAMQEHQAADGATNSAFAPDRYRFLYNGHIYPYPNEAPLPPRSEVLLRSPHPLAWRPYLYEGYTHAQRDRFEATDISMRLVLVPD